MLIYAPCVSHCLQYLYGVARRESCTATADPPPNECKRYVNKTHTIPEEGTLTGLQTHIDSIIDKSIKWTAEGEVETTVEKNGIEKKKKNTGFSGHGDCLTGSYGSIDTRVFRKETK